MSRQSDKVLTESMGRRRPKEIVQNEVAESILAELVPPGSIDVPIESLYRSPFQVREMGSDEEIDRLAESIQTSGLISPVVVRPIAEVQKDLQVKSIPDFLKTGENLQVKSFEIITGHHRVMALMKLGWTSVPVLVKHMTDAQAAVALTADNAIKKDLTDWDRYQSILMLERTGACKTGREVAMTLGVSPAQVSQIRSFGKLPEKVLDVIRENPACCGYKLAYEVVTLGVGEDSTDLLVEAFRSLVSGKIRAQSQLVQWVRLQQAARKPRSYRRELRIQRPGKSAIKLVVTDRGAVIDANDLDPDKLARLIEQNLDELMLEKFTG